MSRARIARAAALLALTAGTVATWSLWPRHHEEASAPAHVAEAPARFAFAWPRGQRLTYSMVWTSESALALAGSGADAAPMRGAIDLRADLVLRSYGARGDAALVAVEVARPTRHAFTVLGADAMPDDASAQKALEGHTGIAEIAPGGVVRSIAFAKDDPEVFKVIAERALAQVLPRLRDDGVLAEEGWRGEEMGPAGRAQVEYRPSIGEPLELSRRRLGRRRSPSRRCL